jgi:hypothetical protein
MLTLRHSSSSSNILSNNLDMRLQRYLEMLLLQPLLMQDTRLLANRLMPDRRSLVKEEAVNLSTSPTKDQAQLVGAAYQDQVHRLQVLQTFTDRVLHIDAFIGGKVEWAVPQE